MRYRAWSPGLYQCTQAVVISSWSATVRTGTARKGELPRMHSVLSEPMVVSAKALSRAIRDRADRQRQPGLGEPDRGVLDRVGVVDRVITHRVPLPGPLGRSLPDRRSTNCFSLERPHDRECGVPASSG